MSAKKKTTLLKPTATITGSDPALLSDLRDLIISTRQSVARGVNAALVMLYWSVGDRIRRDVLHEKRATYGSEILPTLSSKLVSEFGRGYSPRNLASMIRFAEVFPDPEILQSLTAKLSWTHFLHLIYLDDSLKRDFYAEQDLEAAILREIESFILELGTGFAFIARQKRMTIDHEDHYLDLLFYHRHLRCMIAIELKLGEFKASYKGQMELYLAWLNRHERTPSEEKPIGLILCAGKKNETIELLDMEKDGIRVSSYWTEALPKDLLQKKLHEAVVIARANLLSRTATENPPTASSTPITHKPAKSAPTRQQGQFLAYIREYMMRNEQGLAPTHAAFQKFFDLTPPSVNSMLIRLEQRGFIQRKPGQARGIQLVIQPDLIPPLERKFKF